MKLSHLIVSNLMISSMLFILIWLVQVVHYPSFRFIDQKNFINFEIFHKTSISALVMPLMALEIFCLSLLLYKDLSSIPVLASCGLVTLIWFTTIFYSMPCHETLSLGANAEIIERLINTNWPRTIAWTLKLAIAFYLYLSKGVTYE
jgi:hypothetical protein